MQSLDVENLEESFFELEYKYRAKDISFENFLKLMENLNISKRLDVAGWDYYYTKKDSKDEFIRYRASETPELTIKKKTVSTNNWERVEIDLPLNKLKVTKNLVDGWVSLLGFQENFTIYKFCSIFYDENITYVYYITYDKMMNELDRFIEVEINKKKVDSLYTQKDREIGGFEGPRSVLNQAAANLEILGIKSSNRMKRSLFEIYNEKI